MVTAPGRFRTVAVQIDCAFRYTPHIETYGAFYASIIFKNAASSTALMPNCLALSSFEPGDSP